MPQARTVLHLRVPQFACAVAQASDSRLQGRPFAIVSAAHPRGLVLETSHPARMGA